jgi:hypothetical protein
MAISKVLWLDDNRIYHHYLCFIPVEGYFSVESCKDYIEFIHYLKNNPLPEHICFDHDLQPEHYDVDDWNEYYSRKERLKTGLDCLKWLIAYCKKTNQELPTVSFHTGNLIGKNMMSLLLRDEGLSNKEIKI